MTADDSTGIRFGLDEIYHDQKRQRESGTFDKSLCIPMEILVPIQMFIKRGGFPGLF